MAENCHQPAVANFPCVELQNRCTTAVLSRPIGASPRETRLSSQRAIRGTRDQHRFVVAQCAAHYVRHVFAPPWLTKALPRTAVFRAFQHPGKQNRVDIAQYDGVGLSNFGGVRVSINGHEPSALDRIAVNFPMGRKH